MPRLATCGAAALLLSVPLAAASEPSADDRGSQGGDDELSLLQSTLDTVRHGQLRRDRAGRRGQRDLVMAHVPYNFGHTVENVAMFGSGLENLLRAGVYILSIGGADGITRQASWSEADSYRQPNGEVWGHLNPDLQVLSNVTGCPMYYTPQKYWPRALAEKYFGNRTIFGLLRDPYERLVALFRGDFKHYGGSTNSTYMDSCDVNGAVKQMMKDYISQNRPFTSQCTFLPQAEFWDGPYGVQLPVDNRQFPASMNQVFSDHGYPDFQIQTLDIIHVLKCSESWVGDLDAETRSLVRQVYARDFELLCRFFGYCEREESTCVYQVPQMCPQKVMAQGYRGHALPSWR